MWLIFAGVVQAQSLKISTDPENGRFEAVSDIYP